MHAHGLHAALRDRGALLCWIWRSGSTGIPIRSIFRSLQLSFHGPRRLFGCQQIVAPLKAYLQVC